MRRHGWELPYHPFQVTAIAVFLALVFAFYIFFLPFVESNILKIFVIAAYSPMVMLVFVLYIWCVASDPADVRVLSSKNHDLSLPSFKNKVDPSVASSRNQAEPQAKRHSDTSSNLGSLPAIDYCLDHICMQKSNAEDSLSEDGMHYCSFCDVEVLMYSKHCRVCDKCVDGFDHHCRWLNNCIGRRNYKGFVVLMVSGVFMFILQWSFGLCILVHRFLNGRHFESMLALKLGRSFSSMAYLFVVVLCTILAMAATYLLGQLTCFHAFLMKKGITTYDCAIAKREQKAKSESELPPNILALPAGFLPTPCGEASSARAQQEQDGQISPSLLFDHEVQGSHHPRRSVLKQATDQGVGSWKAFSERFSKRKTSMTINPWNLASLNKQDIVQAVTTSRSRTSTVQPVAHFSKSLVIAQVDSSFHSSRSFRADFIASFGIGSVSRKYSEINLNLLNQSILSTWQNGKLPLDSFEQIDSSENDSGSLSYQAERDDMLIPLQREARNVFKSSHAFSAGGVSLLAAAASSSLISEHACADTFHASTNGYT